MLRDPVGGAAVNLTPRETPADIYSEVLKLVLRRLEEDAQKPIPETPKGEEPTVSDTEKARALLQTGHVDRGLVKRPVMTLPYGAKQYGFRGQIVEELHKRRKDGRDHGLWKDGAMEAGYLARLIWESIGQVVIAAKDGMDWLQKAARLLAAEELPIHWTTPVGFPVLQQYREYQLKKVNTTFCGDKFQLRLRQDTEILDKRKQSNGIAPNFVHSLDAAAMMLTVVGTKARGAHSFAMVHDSYGTHAAHAETLAYTLREEFVRMYEEWDVLEDFKDSVLMQLQTDNQADLPPLPPRGSLDLAEVLDSDFFFA